MSNTTTQQVARSDRANLGRATIDGQGILRAPAVLAAPGVYPYRRADGSTSYELVTADVLAEAESIDSLEGVPLTYLHPNDDQGLVCAVNAAKHAVGAVAGRPTTDEHGALQARVVIHRADVIEMVQQGTRQLSCGYLATVVQEAGVWVDERGTQHQYDSRQTARRYNHVAIVPAGRHGSRACIYIDSSDGAAAMVVDPAPPTTHEDPMKFKIRIDGATVEVDVQTIEEGQAIQAAIDAGLKAKADAAAATDKLNGRIEALEAELQQAKADAAQAKTDAAAAISAERLQARIDRIDAAVRAGIDRTEALKLDDVGLMRAVVAKRYPSVDVKAKSDAAIEGMYELVQEASRKDGLSALGGGTAQGSAGTTGQKEQDPYEAYEASLRTTGYRPPPHH